jgi:hypothetical protein
MRFRALIVFSIIALALFAGACAQGTGAFNPSAPSTDKVTPTAQADSQGLEDGHNLLGYWMISVDADKLTYTISPVRSANMHLNVLNWIETKPCSNCLTISNIQIDVYKNLTLDVTLKHPFTVAKFSGFDVRGIAMFDANLNLPGLGLTTSALYSGDATLENADGYTTLYNPGTVGNGTQGYIQGKKAPKNPVPNSILNGYKTYFSNENRRYFNAGDTLLATYHIVKPASMNLFAFGYAVDASWAKPTEPVTVPTSFPDTANSLEAYKIATEMSGPLSAEAGATATLTIDVYDWQGAATIGEVSVEGPFFWDGLKIAVPAAGGPGTKRFTCELTNDYGFVTPDKYPVVVRVLDTSSAPGALIDNIAYSVVLVQVFTNHPPVCSAQVSNQDPNPGEVITFTDTSTDPDGAADIVTSSWDWDNDGTWDEDGFVVTHSWPSPGVYQVNHIVYDKAGASDQLDTPLSLDIGLFITLQEDNTIKTVGKKYKYISKDAIYGAGSIINIEDLDGPWDFTTIGLSDIDSQVSILSSTDSEVASFVGNFNASTSLFVKSVNVYDPFFPTLYEAENHDFANNLLFIYGFHDPFVIGSSKFGPPDTPDPLAIPYPLTIDTDYAFNINNPGFVLTYQVKTLGEGDVTVPYGGNSTYHCLLIRYKFNVTAAEPILGGTLNYAFVSDSGLVVANVIAVNDPPNLNFTPANKITGTALFQALNSIQ